VAPRPTPKTYASSKPPGRVRRRHPLGDWDLVVLDEINYAISYRMLAPERVAEVLRRKPE